MLERNQRTNRLLSLLSDDDYERLRPHLLQVVLDYRKSLYEASRPIEHVYFPVEGVASLVITTADGASAEVGTIGTAPNVAIQKYLNSKQVPQLFDAKDSACPQSAAQPADSLAEAKLSLAREMMGRHRAYFGVGPDAGFDEEHFVISNAYTGGSESLKKTYAGAPKHRDERFNSLCQKHLDYGRGDDFLQIGSFDLGFARRYLLREVPRKSLLALLLTLASAVLAGMVAPFAQWLDVSRPYGVLRPRN